MSTHTALAVVPFPKRSAIMETKSATQVQKERRAAIETTANELLSHCTDITLTSINERGYQRTCVLTKVHADGFNDIYFITSKRSPINGKASVCYFHGADSVTLIGDVVFETDRATQEAMWLETERPFSRMGVDDPKFRLLHFHTREATFWIDGKFRTCKYR